MAHQRNGTGVLPGLPTHILHPLWALRATLAKGLGRWSGAGRCCSSTDLLIIWADAQTQFFVPPNTKQWIALLQRGNCTFKEKISPVCFPQCSGCSHLQL